jgi:hypothetical protein
MQPCPPGKPATSFLEREIGGVPLFIHVIAVFATCGVYLVLLPFVLLFSAIENRVSRAVDRVVDPVLDRMLKAALVVVAVPAYLVFAGGKWLYQRWTGWARKPADET